MSALALKENPVIFHDGIHPDVAALNFEKLVWKMTEKDKKMSVERCRMAEREYRRFLTLKKLYPGVDLVPSKLIDAFWHEHILDTRAYREDCERVFGHFLDHYPYFGIHDDQDYQNLVRAFERTKGLYEKHFGPYPEEKTAAARCAGHACHVPSECACRVPGACK
ncbi:hypothetical protein D6779_03090 [Candidatus Parcubacteria bacterium]|nr:MAG: hypothetical protein D6779_03090 [Candidatus Parcubacteria bacterium]